MIQLACICALVELFELFVAIWYLSRERQALYGDWENGTWKNYIWKMTLLLCMCY